MTVKGSLRLVEIQPFAISGTFAKRSCWPDRASASFSSMKFRAVVEFDPAAKRWSAVFPELPGCASAGDSEGEAIANALKALELWFAPSPVKLSTRAKLVELSLL